MLTNTTFVKNGVNKVKLVITGMVLRICLLKGPISYLHTTPSLEPETHQEHGQWTARITEGAPTLQLADPVQNS